MKKFILISKDAMCKEYLPIYGADYCRTPNIDALAKAGTVFLNHYSSAPSTVMSFYGMITGVWAHDTEIENYSRSHAVYKGNTMFDRLRELGYEPHIVWDKFWDVLLEYVNCYQSAVIHSLSDIRQGVGAHYVHEGFLKEDPHKEAIAFENIENEIRKILAESASPFIWLHLPHVIGGKVAYGSDMELFDRYVGMIRKYFPDDCIAITADHGNMNGHKGKISYGHDVYNPSAAIPLITPRIGDAQVWEANTSNIDLLEILLHKKVPSREYVYCDSAYRAQPNRKLAIIRGRFKYIYNKKAGTEELYDLKYDPNEEFSLMEDFVYDVDRKVKAPSRELYYYPCWEELDEVRASMRAEKVRIWKEGSSGIVMKMKIKELIRPIYFRMTMKKMQ